VFLSLRDIAKNFGGVAALRGVSLEVEQGAFVCFLGPSGCGKTTLLRVIAGLEEPDRGEILLEGADLTHVPARRRNFGVVFQSYSLFPNMTVSDNVAYGLHCRKWDRQRIAERVERMLTLVHLSDQAVKYPHQLSGGQQQRVALARALAPEPRMLLLDEPLSALDAKVREGLRSEIRDLQSELDITTVMVTHDQDEAMEMADRILVMNDGLIEQIGDAVQLYTAPSTRFVAEFIGRINVLELEQGPDGVPCLAGSAIQRVDGRRSQIIGIRPEDVEIVADSSAQDNVVTGRIDKVVYLGNLTRVTLDVGGQRIDLEHRGGPDHLTPGASLAVKIPSGAIHELEDITS
jgi:iron(III) transport system ATP-binding protein